MKIVQRPWTEYEDERLMELLSQEHSIAFIQRDLGRSRDQIWSRFRRINRAAGYQFS